MMNLEREMREMFDSIANDPVAREKAMREEQENYEKGFEWLKNAGPGLETSHLETVMPIRGLVARSWISELGPYQHLELLNMLNVCISLAVQKGYEKGHRQALASLVLGGNDGS